VGQERVAFVTLPTRHGKAKHLRYVPCFLRAGCCLCLRWPLHLVTPLLLGGVVVSVTILIRNFGNLSAS
jgi:hypothetical protein